jgi:hypothetical protein
VDWRKLEGLEFNVPLRFGPFEGIPDPPDREVKELLEEKIGRLRLLVLDAEERFDPDSFDAEEAAVDARASACSGSTGVELVKATVAAV